MEVARKQIMGRERRKQEGLRCVEGREKRRGKEERREGVNGNEYDTEQASCPSL